jgi:hypothetical protein
MSRILLQIYTFLPIPARKMEKSFVLPTFSQRPHYPQCSKDFSPFSCLFQKKAIPLQATTKKVVTI